MKRIAILMLFILISGCAEPITEADLQHLNGYWEIEKVVFPEGDIKEYRASTTIDYLTLSADNGYRKKVQPRLNGTFLTSDDATNFKIIKKDNSFTLLYSNGLDQWEEQLLKLSAHKFTVVNQDNIRYHYKRYQTTAVEQ